MIPRYSRPEMTRIWSPENRYYENKANHCSYGFWLGASDRTVLVGNEASYNGDPKGFHNSPHLPKEGHAGIVFMFAPLMHPAMRHVGPVRRELGIPTVMNIVGPLANPAGAGRQVVGVADARRVPLIAGALLALGTEHALVVHGEPGMDEISPLGPTQVIEIRDGRTREWSIGPAQSWMTLTSYNRGYNRRKLRSTSCARPR